MKPFSSNRVNGSDSVPSAAQLSGIKTEASSTVIGAGICRPRLSTSRRVGGGPAGSASWSLPESRGKRDHFPCKVSLPALCLPSATMGSGVRRRFRKEPEEPNPSLDASRLPSGMLPLLHCRAVAALADCDAAFGEMGGKIGRSLLVLDVMVEGWQPGSSCPGHGVLGRSEGWRDDGGDADASPHSQPLATLEIVDCRRVGAETT